MFCSLPNIKSHIYWVEKEQFQLKKDRYEEWVLFIVETGIFRFRIGNHEGRAESGDLVLCPPQTTFERETISPVTFHFISFQCDVPSEYPSGRIRLSRQIRVFDNCTELRSFYADRSDFSWILRGHILRDLWLLIHNEYLRGQNHNMMASYADPIMVKIRLYVQEHAFETLRLKDIARRFHLTPVQLTRRFQSAYEIKPIEFLTNLRIQHASELLITKDWTMDSIASACGYENGFYLSRIFSKYMGMSPSMYRRKNRV